MRSMAMPDVRTPRSLPTNAGPGDAVDAFLRRGRRPEGRSSAVLLPRLQCEASTRECGRWSRWNRQDDPPADVKTEGIDAKTQQKRQFTADSLNLGSLREDGEAYFAAESGYTW
jgi:hypothetical protein